MAEGGGTVRDSTDGSDFMHDYPCIPCEKDGRNIAAVKHCVDCDENLCQTCLTQHNKFGLMRGHKVLDKVQPCQGKLKLLPRQRCTKHGGKTIDLFCPDHDNVGCSTCIATGHKSCVNAKFIPDVSTGIKKSKELKQLEISMRKMKSKLSLLKTEKQTSIKRLKQDKAVLQRELHQIRQKINSELDKMEKDLQKEIETKFNQNIKDINEHIAEVDAALKELEDTLEELKRDNPDCDIFVAVKKAKHGGHAKVEEIENREPTLSLKLQTDELVQQLIDGKRLFADLIDKFNIQKVEHIKDINMRLSTDRKPFFSVSICSFSDGNLIIADLSNKTLKSLTIGSHTVSTLVRLPSEPHSVCLIDSNTLAVSFLNSKLIQYVSTNVPHKLGRSFPTSDFCRGVSHSGGLLYVCCGGSIKDSDEGPGHIAVYTRSGELLQKWYNDISWPVRISVINDGHDTTLYISDNVKGVQARGLDGIVKHIFPTTVDTSYPFWIIGKSQLLIGERSSQTVCMHTYNDRRLLLDKRALGGEPCALYVDKKSSRLYVSFYESDVIKVFKLNM